MHVLATVVGSVLAEAKSLSLELSLSKDTVRALLPSMSRVMTAGATRSPSEPSLLEPSLLSKSSFWEPSLREARAGAMRPWLMPRDLYLKDLSCFGLKVKRAGRAPL